ncbi:MAG TPA: hypothetical protein VH814_11575 [Steroidobacteraceae bacterium]|jgi:Zn finger protein HypA/HybF involved in hydrogenase expression
MPPLAPRFDTLGYADDKGLEVVAKCRRCGHESVMNLSKLIGHFGHRMHFEQLAPRLRCRRCKARSASLQTQQTKRICPTCNQVIQAQVAVTKRRRD